MEMKQKGYLEQGLDLKRLVLVLGRKLWLIVIGADILFVSFPCFSPCATPTDYFIAVVWLLSTPSVLSGLNRILSVRSINLISNHKV